MIRPEAARVKWRVVFSFLVPGLTAVLALVVVALGNSAAATECPSGMSAPTTAFLQVPSPAANVGPTPSPVVAFATFCNGTGRAADGLHVSIQTGGYPPQASAVGNAPACQWPSITKSGLSVVGLSWANSCVDPGDTVTLALGSCEQPQACAAPWVACYNWTFSGTPNPSPCDVCPTQVNPQASPSGGGLGDGCDFAAGDVDCDFKVNAVDALLVLRQVARLPVTQNPPCPGIGRGMTSIFGDVDCGGAVDAVDALRILRYASDLPTPLREGCRAIGTTPP